MVCGPSSLYAGRTATSRDWPRASCAAGVLQMSVSLTGHATERSGFSSSPEPARLRQATAPPDAGHPRVPATFGSSSRPSLLIGRGAETSELEALIDRARA